MYVVRAFGDAFYAMSTLDSPEDHDPLVQLAGAVAHELNNIFTAVAGNLSLLDPAETEQASSSATIREVVRVTQRGISLSQKLQAFAGRQKLLRKQVDINYVVASTVHQLQNTLLSSIDVRMKLTDQPTIGHVDDQKLRETIAELAKNALAAMPQGGRLTIETSIAHNETLKQRPHIHIRIADTGKGMPADVARKAFKPMFSTSKAGITAGWGLSSCAGFVRQSGGRIALDSAPGKGTRVDIYLPIE